jgi:hypothetical protein
VKAIIQLTIILCLFSIAACKDKPDEIETINDQLEKVNGFYTDVIISKTDTIVVLTKDSINIKYVGNKIDRIYEQGDSIDWYSQYIYTDDKLSRVNYLLTGELDYYTEIDLNEYNLIAEIRYFSKYHNRSLNRQRYTHSVIDYIKEENKYNREYGVKSDSFACHNKDVFRYDGNKLIEVINIDLYPDTTGPSGISLNYINDEYGNAIEFQYNLGYGSILHWAKYEFDNNKNPYTLLGPIQYLLTRNYNRANEIKVSLYPFDDPKRIFTTSYDLDADRYGIKSYSYWEYQSSMDSNYHNYTQEKLYSIKKINP